MNKVIQDERVSILIPSCTGTYWYTRHKIPELVFDPVVIYLVKQICESNLLEMASAIESYCDKTYGERDYWGDAMYLSVDTLPKGSMFSILYKDDWESINPPCLSEVIFEA